MPNVRIDDSTLEKAMSLFPDGKQNSAVKNCIDGYERLRLLSYEKIRAYFDRGELTALLFCFQKDDLSQAGRNQIILGKIEDYELFKRGISKEGANLEALKNKISRLSPPEIFFLQEVVYRFWNDFSFYGAPAADMQEFLNYFQK